MRRLFRRLAALLVVAPLALACSAQQAKSAADVQACYAKFSAPLLARVRAECQGHSFAACPAHDAIMAEWSKGADACEQP